MFLLDSVGFFKRLVAGGGGGGGGGDVTPTAVNWSNIFDPIGGGGITNAQTLAGVTYGITVSVDNTGSAIVYWSIDGAAYQIYAAPFPWLLGQALTWLIQTLDNGPYSGTVTPNNDSLGPGNPLDVITYHVGNS